MIFTEKEKQAISAVLDAYFKINKPASKTAYWTTLPSDTNVVERFENLLSNSTDIDIKNAKALAKLLTSPLLGLTWGGSWKPAHQLDTTQLEKMLKKWAISAIPTLRVAFLQLKAIATYYFFGVNNNSNWKAIGYKIDFPPATKHKAKLNFISLQDKKQLYYDAVIVGSGTGGSIMAAELAKAGLKVLVIEKGDYIPPQDMTFNEDDMIYKLYERKGIMGTVQGDMSLLAGSTLGGGSTINWAGSFKTPDYVLEEWAKEHHNEHFLTTAYKKGFDEVEKALGVTSQLSKHNPQNQALYDGAKHLGLNPEIIPRNIQQETDVDDTTFWKAQGFSPHGDAFRIKRSGADVFLEKASAYKTDILINTLVKTVTVKNGVAVGVEVQQGETTIKIHAKRVIISAGSLYTPVILRKSGLRHRQIGRNLYLHPTSFVFGKFSHKVEGWHGPMMSTLVNDFSKIKGNYGFKLETPPFHPGALSVILPWQSPQQYKKLMTQCANIGTFIILTRDKYGGWIDIDKSGQPLINYKMHNFDRKNMIRGFEETLKIMAAAQPDEVFLPRIDTPFVKPNTPDFKKLVQQIQKMKWQPGHFNYGSAHQMGTCRMGGNKKTHPVKPNGETWEIKNLYVADASLFPTASGVNPMESIYVLSYYVAQQIKNSI